jgi:hypothetical protein
VAALILLVAFVRESGLRPSEILCVRVAEVRSLLERAWGRVVPRR